LGAAGIRGQDGCEIAARAPLLQVSHSDARLLLSGISFDVWLTPLQDKADWVEFPHDDSTIQIATGTPRGM